MTKHCKGCNGTLVLELMPEDHMHYGKWTCQNSNCEWFGRYQGWEKAPKNERKRNDHNAKWRRQWQERGPFVCGMCGVTQDVLKEASQWQLDHIVPLSIGGLDEFENTMMLCRYCHTTKHSMQHRTMAILKRGGG